MLDRQNVLWRTVYVLFPAMTLLLSINQIFNLRVFGFLPMLNEYLYLLLALNLSMVFLHNPIQKDKNDNKISLLDVLLFFLAIGINVYFAFHAETMILKAWEHYAPMLPTILSLVQWGIIIEGVRRTNGKVLALFCLVFSLYPLFAEQMPFFLSGQSYTFLDAAKMHILGVNSVLGIPLQVVASLLIGFMLFGIVLQHSGGGKFFMDFSTSTFGHVRGGPAKVAVVASALFGSLSGSAISNVITSGSVTIPAMKKSGYKDYYAAAVEACASTGGNIMPPVMGAAAFVMASFLGIDYFLIVIAAIIPALLYYLGLFFQVDSYAIKHDLQGLPKSELPKLSEVFKDGWFYILGFVVMFYFIFFTRMTAKAPFFASLTLIVIAILHKNVVFKKQNFLDLLESFGKQMAAIVSILAAVGLIIGGLMITGVALSFSRELVHAVTGVFPLLVVGAITSFILGFGLTSTAVYILLSIVLAPALQRMGIEPISAHFFILYWGILSFITPPVAIASYAAAGVAESDPTKTGLVGMRLGFVSYIIPFAFVYNPALLAQGGLFDIFWYLIMAVVGVYFIATSFEGYMGKIGAMKAYLRIGLTAMGILLLVPDQIVNIISLVAGIGLIASARLKNSRVSN